MGLYCRHSVLLCLLTATWQHVALDQQGMQVLQAQEGAAPLQDVNREEGEESECDEEEAAMAILFRKVGCSPVGASCLI